MSDAVEQVRADYDKVPYTSHVFPQTAPERLAAIAHLFGLDPPPVATARVLEIGCSSGGNLVAFAARRPQASALGLDLSQVQIDLGLKRVQALGLGNLELRQADIAQVDSAQLGTFDYILCHGVYSWVPENVQDAILRVCSANLAPDGVAYISYNTYPGWKGKEILRDAMLLRGGERATPGEKLGYARGMLDFLAQVAPKGSVLERVLELHGPDMRKAHDYYLLHEYLESFNAPSYLRQFLHQARGRGLAYLGEADPSMMFVDNYPKEIAEPLRRECGSSQVMLEQYLDFAVNRAFRQTLLVHEARSRSINYRMQRDRLRALHFATSLLPQDGPTRLDRTLQAYGPSKEQAVSSVHPEVKVALDVLSAAWPNTVSVPELIARVEQHLQQAGVSPQPQLQDRIEDLLELLLMRAMASYWLDPVTVASADLAAAGTRVMLDATIRGVAGLTRLDREPVTFNAWHETLHLTVVERWLLPLLDGQHDRAALVERLSAHAQNNELHFHRGGHAVTDPDDIRACAAEHVETLFKRLRVMKLVANPA